MPETAAASKMQADLPLAKSPSPTPLAATAAAAAAPAVEMLAIANDADDDDDSYGIEITPYRKPPPKPTESARIHVFPCAPQVKVAPPPPPPMPPTCFVTTSVSAVIKLQWLAFGPNADVRVDWNLGGVPAILRKLRVRLAPKTAPVPVLGEAEPFAMGLAGLRTGQQSRAVSVGMTIIPTSKWLEGQHPGRFPDIKQQMRAACAATLQNAVSTIGQIRARIAAEPTATTIFKLVIIESYPNIWISRHPMFEDCEPWSRETVHVTKISQTTMECIVAYEELIEFANSEAAHGRFKIIVASPDSHIANFTVMMAKMYETKADTFFKHVVFLPVPEWRFLPLGMIKPAGVTDDTLRFVLRLG